MLLYNAKKDTFQVKITVMGVGGGGSNAVDAMIGAGLSHVSIMAVNTDLQCLSRSSAPSRLQIGEKVTGGLGAGANPAVGHQAAVENLDQLHEVIEDCNILILIAGMGGGTGTGAAPVIAQTARQQGKMVIAFVTTPFEFEGATRKRNAASGIDELREHAHTLIVIPNEKLYDLTTEDTTCQEGFFQMDDLLTEAVAALTRMILEPGMINVDFADVKAVMSIVGGSVMTFGEAQGIHRASKAVENAMSSLLLDNKRLKGAKGLLVNILGGPDLTFQEVTKSVRKIKTGIHEDANIIFGVNVDPSMQDRVMVTIIATGIEESFDGYAHRSGMAFPEAEPFLRQEYPSRMPGNDGSALFEATAKLTDDELDVPTYIRRNKMYLSTPRESEL